jgi:MFS family permease
MALVFAPAVVIIARLVRGGGSGTGVGIFNSAYDVGGILALFLWGVIASSTGWRPSLELSGALGVLSGFLVLVAAPADEQRPQFRVRADQFWRVVADKRLITIAVGMLAVGVGNGLISSFMEYYLVGVFKVGAAEAGLIASMVVIAPIFSALYAGRTYDRSKSAKKLMILSNIGGSAALAVCAVPSIASAIVCSVFGGLTTGLGLTVGFAAAKDLHTAEREYDGLAVAWVNCISLSGAVFPPVVFSYFAVANGYPYAWLAGALLTAVLAAPLLALNEKKA